MKEVISDRKRVFVGKVKPRLGLEYYPVFQGRVEVGAEIILVGATTEADRDRLVSAVLAGPAGTKP